MAPGFIDAHVHGDLALFRDPSHEPAIRQGVTTYLIGQDGFGFAPTTPQTFSFMSDYLAGIYGDTAPLGPGSLHELLARYDGTTTVNVATLVPSGCIRMGRSTPSPGCSTRPTRRRRSGAGSVTGRRPRPTRSPR